MTRALEAREDQPAECPVRCVWIHGLHLCSYRFEVFNLKFVDILAFEELLGELFNPFLVRLRRGRVPTVEAVELCT